MKKGIDRPYSLVIQASTFGDAARSVVLASGTKNWVLSISKNMRIEEQASIQFRTGMHNAFNHAQLRGVNANIDPALVGVMGTLSSDRGPRNIQFGLRIEF